MSSRQFWLSVGLLLSILAVGCGPQAPVIEVTRATIEEVTTTVEIEVTREVTIVPDVPTPEIVEVIRIVTETAPLAPLGSAERPLQVVLAPLLAAQISEFRGEALLTDLAAALELEVELILAESHGAAVAALCDRPAQTIAILPGVLAHVTQQECDAYPALVAARQGVPYTAGMLVVRTDRGIFTLADLNGQTWAIPDDNSWESYLYFQALLAEQGITPGDITITNGDSNTMLAVQNQEVAFATASFLPPLLPFLAEWQYGEDDPEIWRSLGLSPYRHPRGFIVVLALAQDGGYQIRDARAAIYDVEPNVFAQTTILTLGGRFPNETVVFGREIPVSIAQRTEAFIGDYVQAEACQQSLCSGDFYLWDGVAETDVDTFAAIAFTAAVLQMDASDLLARFDN